MKSLLSIMTLSLGLMATTATQAALFDRGGGLIYDDDLNITWLADANYAMTSGFDVDGLMSWTNANAWAAGLSYFDSVRNVTYEDWRLPNMDINGVGLIVNCQFASVTACLDNEYGYQFWKNGVTEASPSPFSNVLVGRYWSGTEVAHLPDYAWWYGFRTGGPGNNPKEGNHYHAWAVRNGDVSAVPLPAALWLFGSGLLGLAAVTRRRHPLRAVT